VSLINLFDKMQTKY